jgi:hypothetical protein
LFGDFILILQPIFFFNKSNFGDILNFGVDNNKIPDSVCILISSGIEMDKFVQVNFGEFVTEFVVEVLVESLFE